VKKVSRQPRCELRDQRLQVRGDAHEHVFQVLGRRDGDQFAALDERIQQGGPASALEAAREEPVLRPTATTRS
jgi:hypothetical protein